MVCVSFRFVTLNKIRITRATKRARSRGAGGRAVSAAAMQVASH